MKTIKHITIYSIFFLTFVIHTKAQDIVDISSFNIFEAEGKYYKDLNNNFAPFLGTWEWQNGNQTFRVRLWKEEMVEQENGSRPSFWKDTIKGHYEMVMQGQVGQQVEITIYTSQKKIGNTTTDWFPVITGTAYDNTFSGSIHDNTLPLNNDYPLGVRGHLSLKIIQGSNPLKMEWKIKLPEGIYGNDQPTEFNIPTDIILTKQ